MGGSQKPKSVSWASDLKLCQIKLFMSGESPSRVGLRTQEHLKTKPIHSSGDDLPPGFERIQPPKLQRIKFPQVPLMKWRCPPRFEVNNEWQVVSGEESKENKAQNQREMRVLEAIYPRPSTIPPNPSAFPGLDNSVTNDKNTPIVPITPIEDQDADNEPFITQPQKLSYGTFSCQSNADTNLDANGSAAIVVDPDVVSSAKAALASVMSNCGIDPDLLMKLLTNPKMVAQLLTIHNASSTVQNMPVPSPIVQNVPSSSVQNMPFVGVQTMPSIKKRDPPSAHITRPEVIPPPMSTAMGHSYPPQIRIGSSSSPAVGVSMTKDINYYKSLIQQHGGERRDISPQFAQQSIPPKGVNQEPLKPKIMKPCIYFNSSRGCRNGANCSYQHDRSFQQRVTGFPEVQSAKRMKLENSYAFCSMPFSVSSSTSLH